MRVLEGDERFGAMRRSRVVGVAGVVILHGVLAMVLWQFESVRQVIKEPVPIMVHLLAAPVVPEPSTARPAPLPVRPRTERVRSVAPQPAADPVADAPGPVLVTPPESQAPRAVVADEPRPAVPRPPAPAAPVSDPIVPPSFHADYLDNPPPAYPSLARRRGEQGRVVLRVLVHPRGTADTVELRTSSGSGLLDAAALDAVRRWRFVPARQGDQAVAAWVLVPVSFTLGGR